MGGMTLAYLIQHGEKEPLPGDPGLTGTGRRQATRTGRWLLRAGVRGLCTSPMRRARETADCIASVTGLAVQADARLRERMNWDGSLPLDAFLAAWAHTMQDRDWVPADGESSRQAGARLQEFLAGLPAAPGPSRSSPTAESPSICCATCSAMRPCPRTCWLQAQPLPPETGQ